MSSDIVEGGQSEAIPQLEASSQVVPRQQPHRRCRPDAGATHLLPFSTQDPGASRFDSSGGFVGEDEAECIGDANLLPFQVGVKIEDGLLDCERLIVTMVHE